MLLIYYFTLFWDGVLLRRIPRRWWYEHRLVTILWVVKGILHWLTGKSEIARILEDPTLSRVQQCLLIKASLKYSRTIKDLRDASHIAKVKNLRADMLQPIMERLNKLSAIKEQVERDCNTPVTDLSALQGCFARLMPEATPPTSFDDAKWADLGFQGRNPLTDFRAMGLFGLKQLVAWSRRPEAPAQHQEAAFGPYWYNTALVSIHLSNWLVTKLKQDYLDEILLQEEQGLDDLHADAFAKFHMAWMAAKPVSIMDFPAIWRLLEPSLLK